jgi:transcriptional regulator with XRE-family HTH domain
MVACMPERRSWAEYVKTYAQEDKQGAIAEKMGVQSSTVGHWLTGKTKRPDAPQAINFARIYRRSVIEALIHAGYIEADEVGEAIEIAGSMRDVSDKALLEELAGRLADFRRILMGGNNTQDWPPPGWEQKNPGMGVVENGDNGG